MLVLAHRGLSAHYVENTQIAFEKALEKGAKAIECDVHQVGDEFVIFHDYDLARLCGTSGSIEDITFNELKLLKVKGQHTILTLSELLSLFGSKVLLNLELKSIKKASHFISYLENCLHSFESVNLVLSSFNHPLIQSLQRGARGTRLNNVVKFAALIGHLPTTGAQYAIDLGTELAACDAHLVNADFVTHAHRHNIEVWAYTVNDEALLRKLFKMGMDGIFSDDVGWAMALINTLYTDGRV